jgi:hypothetical protein
MLANFRNFTVQDPFGRTWTAEFRWLQNAISIRHADAVDLKYYLSEGQDRREIVIALPHPLLLAVAEQHGRQLTDAWCLHLAGLHLAEAIRTWNGLENAILTLSQADLERHAGALEQPAAARR